MSDETTPSLRQRLTAPVDAAGLAVFRILTGFVMLVEVYRYLKPRGSSGWSFVSHYFVDVPFHATYWGFDWVQPWAGHGMIWHYALMGVAAACIMLGLAYRVAAPAYFLLFTYAFLAEKARYLNHHYLVAIVGLLLCLAPAHRYWSLDARLGWTRSERTAPAWSVWMFRVQFGLVYFFAAVAKFTPDWLRGLPVKNMVSKSAHLPVIGPYVGEAWFIYFIAYAGLLIDLVAFPALLHPRTRIPMALVLMGFHLSNATMFNIGIFPWFMIATTAVFFPPASLRALAAGALRGVGMLTGLRPLWRTGRGMQAGPPEEELASRTPSTGERALLGLLALHFLVQFLAPLRHHLVPGNPEWHEVGHRWAWRMKLRSRRAAIRFFALDLDTLEEWEIPGWDHARGFQGKKLAKDPDQAHQFALYLKEKLAEEGHERVDIRAVCFVSLNRRRPQLLIDPQVNLAAEPRVYGVPSWVKPLVNPPPDLGDRNPPKASTYAAAYPVKTLFRDAVAAELERRNAREKARAELPHAGFDEAANPAADLRAARAEAARTGRRILLKVGGNWCLWCRIMEKYFHEEPEAAAALERGFVVMKVNVSKAVKNEAFLSAFPEVSGYPHLFVLDADGKLLHSQDTAALEAGKGYDGAKFMAFLHEWGGAGKAP